MKSIYQKAIKLRSLSWASTFVQCFMNQKHSILFLMNKLVISNYLPNTSSIREAIIMIRGEPFLVTPRAPILPEYEVTPTPDPINDAQRHPNP